MITHQSQNLEPLSWYWISTAVLLLNDVMSLTIHVYVINDSVV